MVLDMLAWICMSEELPTLRFEIATSSTPVDMCDARYACMDGMSRFQSPIKQGSEPPGTGVGVVG